VQTAETWAPYLASGDVDDVGNGVAVIAGEAILGAGLPTDCPNTKVLITRTSVCGIAITQSS
jgi:hypothetical protein